MNLDKVQLNISENSQLKNKFEEFEKIKDPDELLLFMKNNLNYGFVGKDGKTYSSKDKDWGRGPQPEIKLQSPEDVLESGHGTCIEQVELEREWFKKSDFEFKTFLMMFDKENISQKNPAHTFLVFKKDNKWYWLENTLDNHNGIHSFNNLEDLIAEVKTILIDNALNSGATKDNIKKYRLYEYDTPIHGGTNEEFVSRIIEQKIKSRNELLALEKDGRYVFHGSMDDIDTLEPHQAFNDNEETGQREKDGDPAVFATPYADVAIFRSLVNSRDVPENSKSSWNIDDDNKLHFFTTENLLEASKKKIGKVYVLDKEKFDDFKGFECRSKESVIPVKVIEVAYEDLPEDIKLF